MKLRNMSALTLCLISSIAIADDHQYIIENIDVIKTELSTLSIQNLSGENIAIDLFSETFDLPPASGLQFECSGYQFLELQILNNSHEFFEVACQSRVVITESFSNQNIHGE